MARDKYGLTMKQRTFADEYIINKGNATRAAIKAGYSEKSARFIGEENLTKPNIRTYIDERLAEMEQGRVLSQKDILEALSAVWNGEVEGTALVGVGMGEQQVKNIKPSVSEKLKALESLARIHGMFKEKLEIEDVTPRFIEDVPDDDDEE